MKTILWNWKKRADFLMKRTNGYHRDALRNEIALALQKAYADGRKAGSNEDHSDGESQ